MVEFLILHASDIHISKRPKTIGVSDRISAGVYIQKPKGTALVSSYDPAVLSAFVDFVHTNAGAIDAILLTGDIATTGLDADLRLALDFVEGSPKPTDPRLSLTGHPSLGGINKPIWLLPGNHDRLERSVVGYSPGGTGFDTVFHRYWSSTDAVTPYPTVIRNGIALQIIAADFNLKTARDRTGNIINQYAQGKVYPTILKTLVQRTEDAKKNSKEHLIVVWAVHFPPQFPNLAATMRLLDEIDLINEANKCGVLAILAGHTHIPVQYRSPGMRFDVLCAGTAAQYVASDGNYLHILSIRVDAQKNMNVRRDDFRFDRFNNKGSLFVKV